MGPISGSGWSAATKAGSRWRPPRHWSGRRAPLGVSVISVWEIALSASKGRIGLGLPVQDRIRRALDHPGLTLVGLDPQIAIESCNLPGTFHVDPADRFLVATARGGNGRQHGNPRAGTHRSGSTRIALVRAQYSRL